MRILQAVNGVFHHFELARQLEAQGHTGQIFSTFPWRRLQREGLPRNRVRTFPWIHTPQLLAGRYMTIPEGLNREWTRAVFETFDARVARSLTKCDVYVALSGSGLQSGRRAQELGARYVCDRGSSHIRYQDELVSEELQRWGVRRRAVYPFMLEREEAEYAQADAITVPSEFARQSFIEQGVPAAKVVKIPYGVRLERFHPVGVPPADSFEVLFTGTVGFRKGIPYLLEAFRKLRHPRKRLRIAGPVQDDIRPWLATQNLDSIEILGRMPQSKLVELMSTSHVMVLPSIEEGLALVQGQALACSCPLISSENTGGSDLFSHGVEGFIVPIRSADAIAERLQQLADDPGLRQSMSEAALRRVKSLGGWDQYGAQYAELLRKLSSDSTAAVASPAIA
jgi:alpha-maltose-1-phosphate synthase